MSENKYNILSDRQLVYIIKQLIKDFKISEPNATCLDYLEALSRGRVETEISNQIINNNGEHEYITYLLNKFVEEN